MPEARQRNPEQGVNGSPPSKRQRMLSKACEYCKAKKLRCDSSRPCESCSRKGLECVYKEKGQPGLRPGYGKDVERRLTALERGYSRMNQILEQNMNIGQENAASVAVPDTLNSSELRITNGNPYEAQATAMIPGSEGNMELDQSLQTTESRIFPNRSNNVMTLPSADILLDLAELYFVNIHSWAPLFHKPTFMADMFTPGREILLHGLVVVTFQFWTKPTPSLEQRNAFVEESRRRLLLHCTDTCNIVSTQALTLLAIDAIGQGPSTRMWNILSMLTASIQQLTLTREPLARETESGATPMVGNNEPENTVDATAVAAEERRRLFWTIFSIERFGSVSLGQPGGIPVKSIKLRRPVSDEEWSQGGLGPWFQPTDPVKLCSSSQPWTSYVDLLSLLDRSNRLLIQPFDFSLRAHREEWQCNFRMLDVTLNTWLEHAPRPCRDPLQAFDPMWTMTRATFELIKLRLYTVASFPSGSSSGIPPSASARVRCRESVRAVANLSTGLKPDEIDRLGPTFAFVVWVAARSLVILWTSGYESTQVSSVPVDLETLMSVLQAMSSKWPCAGRSFEIIKLIMDTHNDLEGANHLKIFSDTRRTSYGLEMLLGQGALRQDAVDADVFDFFDMTFADVGEMNQYLEPIDQGATQDWLAL